MSEFLNLKNSAFVGDIKDYIDEPAMEFDFECDDFQKHSFLAIENGENVLVTAHTGSGKTVVALYAIAYHIKKGRRVVYNSPIKTLSNQKYNEFREYFEGEFAQKYNIYITVGIMTGDNKINPDANLVIMTTEILRNALYEINLEDENKKDLYFEDNFIESLGCVIFDEVHYINDRDRGHVWEESIVLLNREVNLVMLSATIDKSEDFASWIGNKKKKIINLIPTTHRVIPLEHFLFVDGQLFKIQNKEDAFFDTNFDRAKRKYDEIKKEKGEIKVINLLNDFVKHLHKKDLLQTICFDFSRKNC